MAAAAKRLVNLPHPARVRMGAGGVPVQVDGRAIEAVRESWLVEDRWWTARPLRRRYWEVVTTSGRNVVVFHDLGADAEPERAGFAVDASARAGGWFVQGP